MQLQSVHPLTVNNSIYSVTHSVCDIRGQEDIKVYNIDGVVVMQLSTAKSGYQQLTFNNYATLEEDSALAHQIPVNFHPTCIVDGMRQLINLFLH